MSVLVHGDRIGSKTWIGPLGHPVHIRVSGLLEHFASGTPPEAWLHLDVGTSARFSGKVDGINIPLAVQRARRESLLKARRAYTSSFYHNFAGIKLPLGTKEYQLLQPIGKLELSTQQEKLLRKFAITLIGDLVHIDPRKLTAFKGFGAQSLEKIESKLEFCGLSLGMDIDWPGILMQGMEEVDRLLKSLPHEPMSVNLLFENQRPRHGE